MVRTPHGALAWPIQVGKGPIAGLNQAEHVRISRSSRGGVGVGGGPFGEADVLEDA